MSKVENKRSRTSFRRELISLGLKRKDMSNEDNVNFKSSVDLIVKNEIIITFKDDKVYCYDEFENEIIDIVTAEAIIEFFEGKSRKENKSKLQVKNETQRRRDMPITPKIKNEIMEMTGTDRFYFVGYGREEDNMSHWCIYQTEDTCQLFALDNDEHITFEVYEEGAEFLVYG